MNKKVKSILVAAILLVAIFGGLYIYQNVGGSSKDKTIEVLIKDNKDKTIFNEKVETNAKKLSNLLKEMKKDKKIKLDYEDGAYGMFITGMGVNTLLENDATKSLYWVYTSDNNKSCVKAGYCDAANTLKIADEDKFVFTLSDGN